MEVVAEYLENTRFEVAAREHRVICDQPRENGGADSGMSPPEFLLASLATCAAYYAAQYLKVRNLPVQIPYRRNVTGLEQRHEANILRAVRACLIHNTLLAQPHIDVVLNTAVLAKA